MRRPAVLAWDGPTRLFKWTLVLVVFDGWLSNKYGGSLPAWHKCNGYAALVQKNNGVYFAGFGKTILISRCCATSDHQIQKVQLCVRCDLKNAIA